MISDYWGDFADGRLGRQRFILLWVILVAVFIAFGLAVGASIGLAEKMVGGNMAEAQAHLRKNFSLPVIIIAAAFAILALLAKLNIIAKRARDIGLPGWITAIIIAGLVGMVSQYQQSTASGGLGFFILIVLALIPSNALRR